MLAHAHHDSRRTGRTCAQDFRLHVAIDGFEKAGDKHPMRIGGIITTDGLDQQGEQILQDGLDFSYFLRRGWLNDNHAQDTAGVIGYPVAVKRVRKGERLPNGKVAPANGHYMEGYLLPTERGRQIWEIARALTKSPAGRRLGFSIEGKIEARDPKRPHVIARAKVRNVAVTHCPVNTDTEMEALAKSEAAHLVKALTAAHSIGTDAAGGAPGDGAPLRRESLEGSPLHPKGAGMADEQMDERDEEREDLEQTPLDEDEDEDADKAKKAEEAEQDLLKAIQDYEVVEQALTEQDLPRRQQLEAKLEAGTITKAERVELGRLWAGDAAGEEPLHKSLTDAVTESELSRELYDASEFLQDLVGGIDDALKAFRTALQGEGAKSRELIKAQGQLMRKLAATVAAQGQVVREQGELVKSLQARLEQFEAQPAGPRALGAIDPRAVRDRAFGKSLGATGDRLTHSDIIKGFRLMTERAARAGDEQALDRLTHETALYESTRRLSPTAEAAIRKELGREVAA